MATDRLVLAVQRMVLCADTTLNRTPHASHQCSGRTKAFSMSLHKLLVHIRTRSSGEVDDTIRRIRAGGDPLEIAKSLSIV
jgi:hypothetical protein